MKRFVLFLIKLVLIIAPLVNLYIYVTMGGGKAHNIGWWQKNIGYVVWALGAYLIMFWACRAYFINWAQIILLATGTAGLIGFYFVPGVYKFFVTLDLFKEHSILLPILPYAYVVLILSLTSLFKKRRR